MLVGFRDHLTRHRTLEAAYLDVVRQNLRFPAGVSMDRAGARDRCAMCWTAAEDTSVLRAAELFFRPQKLTLHEGSLVAADEETVSGLGGKPLVAAGVDAGPARRPPRSTS